MSLVAVYRQPSGHVAIAAPEYAVAAHDDGTETNVTTVGECTKGFLVSVDDGQHFITANPHLGTMTILGLHINVADGHIQMA